MSGCYDTWRNGTIGRGREPDWDLTITFTFCLPSSLVCEITSPSSVQSVAGPGGTRSANVPLVGIPGRASRLVAGGHVRQPLSLDYRAELEEQAHIGNLICLLVHVVRHRKDRLQVMVALSRGPQLEGEALACPVAVHPVRAANVADLVDQLSRPSGIVVVADDARIDSRIHRLGRIDEAMRNRDEA